MQLMTTKPLEWSNQPLNSSKAKRSTMPTIRSYYNQSQPHIQKIKFAIQANDIQHPQLIVAYYKWTTI